MHRVLFLAMVAVCWLPVGCLAQRSRTTVPPRPTPDVIDTVRSSIVQVVVELEDPNIVLPPTLPSFSKGIWVVGTGFFVNGNGDVATAYHVVSDATLVINKLHGMSIEARIKIGVPLPNADLGRGITISQNFSLYPMQVKAASVARDLAILSPTGTKPLDGVSNFVGGAGTGGYPKGTVAAAKLETTRPRDGDEVLAAGFPLGSLALESTTGHISSAWMRENLSTAKVNGSSEVSDVYHLDLRINPGNSGGPLFDMNSHGVLGIVVEFIAGRIQSDGSVPGDGLAVVVPSKYITELLTAPNQTGVERLRISPIVDTYSTLTNQQLQQVAVDVAAQLRGFQTRMVQEQHALDAQFDHTLPLNDLNERRERFQHFATQQSDLSQRIQREYSSTVGRNATNVFRALRVRLPTPTPRTPTTPQDFDDLLAIRILSTGHLTGDVLVVADYIERLAKELP